MDLQYDDHAPSVIAHYGLKRVGKELHGACPECGGKDRFWIFRKADGGLGVNCRQCGDFKAIFDRMRDDGVLPKWQSEPINCKHKEWLVTDTYIDKKGFSEQLVGGAFLVGKTLCVPMIDLETGANLGIQRIEPNGEKRFAKGSETANAIHEIGILTDIAYAVEGWASGHALHLATGRQVFVCFSADGLAKKAARIKHPNVIVAADNDDVGRKAAKASGRPWVAPEAEGADWWDVWHQGGSEAVKAQLESQSSSSSSPQEIEPKPFCLRPTQDIPPRQWLYGRQFIRGFLSLTVAPGGLGKSSMLIAECLSMVSGKPILGIAPARPLNVWVWNGEDPYEETERRIAAACSHYGLSAADLGGRLRMDSGRDLPIALASYASGKVDINAGQASELVKALQKAEIDVLIIDPFVTSHQVPENDTTGMNAVVATFRNIASKANCAIELVHHVSKNGAMNAQDLGIYASRGAGAVIDGVRVARQLIRMTQDQAEKFGVEKPSDYFSVNSGKANLAPLEKVEWRQMISVPLHNGSDLWPEGDWVGVCSPWTPPDAFDGVQVRDLKAVQDAIDALDEPPAFSSRAHKWVGYVIAKVLGLDVGEVGSEKRDRETKQNSARARIGTMINTWIKSEAMLVEEVYSSRDSRNIKVVVVGERVTSVDLNP